MFRVWPVSRKGAAGLALLAAVGLATLATEVVLPGIVAGVIERELEDRVEVDVEVDSVEIEILGPQEIHGLRFLDTDGNAILSCETAWIDADILDLASEGLAEKSMVLDRPVLRLARDESGALRFPRSGCAGGGGYGGAGSHDLDEAPSFSGVAQARSGSVSGIEVRDGRIEVEDLASGWTARLSGVSARLSSSGHGRPVRIEAKGRFANPDGSLGEFEADGETLPFWSSDVSLLSTRASLSIVATGCSLEAVRILLGDVLPFERLAGVAAFDVQTRMDGQGSLRSRGRIVVRDFLLSGGSLGDTILAEPEVRIEHDLEVRGREVFVRRYAMSTASASVDLSDVATRIERTSWRDVPSAVTLEEGFRVRLSADLERVWTVVGPLWGYDAPLSLAGTILADLAASPGGTLVGRLGASDLSCETAGGRSVRGVEELELPLSVVGQRLVVSSGSGRVAGGDASFDGSLAWEDGEVRGEFSRVRLDGAPSTPESRRLLSFVFPLAGLVVPAAGEESAASFDLELRDVALSGRPRDFYKYSRELRLSGQGSLVFAGGEIDAAPLLSSRGIHAPEDLRTRFSVRHFDPIRFAVGRGGIDLEEATWSTPDLALVMRGRTRYDGELDHQVVVLGPAPATGIEPDRQPILALGLSGSLASPILRMPGDE